MAIVFILHQILFSIEPFLGNVSRGEEVKGAFDSTVGKVLKGVEVEGLLSD